MATKILNVQKSDSFDEVFDAFKQADAQEVIFIFPKGTVFAQDASYFETIKQESITSGKAVNIMTTDPLIAHLASKNELGILQNPAPKARKAPPAVIAQEVIADLAVARKVKDPKPEPDVTPSGRKIKDIVANQDDQPVEVQSTEEKDVILPINSAPAISKVSLIPKVEPQAPIDNDIERLWAEEEQRQGGDPQISNTQKTSRWHGKFSKKLIIIPVVFLVIVAGLMFFIIPGKAKIIVSPQIQDIDMKLKITASAATDKVNVDFNRVPGQEFSAQKDTSGDYPTTSQKEVAQKSTGKVTIFNKSATPQRLVATTRFESKDGLIFRIPETITVPANGSVASLVYADRPGKEYNIESTQFTIPGFKDTPRFDQFYATSSGSMTGGIIGTAKVISEQDFIKAQTELTNRVKEEVVKALKDQVGELTFIEPVDVTMGTPETNGKVGDAVETLHMSISASAKLVAFRNTDVQELIVHYLSKNSDVELIQKDLHVEFALVNKDIENKTITFEAIVKGRAATKLNSEKIIHDILGMNEVGIRSYFGDEKDVVSAKVLLSPFWIKKVPSDTSKVELIVDIQ